MAPIEYLRESLRLLAQSMIEWEVSAAIAASHYERNTERRTQRNGYRQRTWQTQLGEITLFIPKLRKGAYYPSLLERLAGAESKLRQVAEDAYQKGISQPALENLVEQLDLPRADANHLADISEQLYDLVDRYRGRRSTASYPESTLIYAVSNRIVRLDSPNDDLPRAALNTPPSAIHWDWIAAYTVPPLQLAFVKNHDLGVPSVPLGLLELETA